eukprot:6465427-Pyramimonas_sp.AAC.1
MTSVSVHCGLAVYQVGSPAGAPAGARSRAAVAAAPRQAPAPEETARGRVHQGGVIARDDILDSTARIKESLNKLLTALHGVATLKV